jgi:hypothetical protein
MKRVFVVLFFSLLIGGAFFWSSQNIPEARKAFNSIMSSGKFQTLEVRYTPESIMEAHKSDLLADDQHTFAEPKLYYHPYLMMEIKYSKSNLKTAEGLVLWSLVDGEMVINTTSWETTHGFTDCIAANADKEDFRIINALSSHQGYMDREHLSTYLNVENPTLDAWLDKCRAKKLIAQSGNIYRLHLENPHLKVLPETQLHHWLVFKNSKNANWIPKHYSIGQIETIAKAAFGTEFAIRNAKEIYIPIYSITVQNPDGSQLSTYWNALNGKKLPPTFQVE